VPKDKRDRHVPLHSGGEDVGSLGKTPDLRRKLTAKFRSVKNRRRKRYRREELGSVQVTKVLEKAILKKKKYTTAKTD